MESRQVEELCSDNQRGSFACRRTGFKAVAVARALRYSPRSEAKDQAIIDEVAEKLGARVVSEDELQPADLEGASVVLTMARSDAALAMLSEAEAQGALVINTPRGIATCRRSRIEALMRNVGIPVAPEDGSCGYWLKRGDGAAQSAEDVVYCADREALEAAKSRFRSRGITDMTVAAHVEGDLVKFYGVASQPIGGLKECEKAENGLFRVYYPGDDGISKFGDEARNGVPSHYAYSQEALRGDVDKLAKAAGVAVYGGDAIVRADGSYCIIDFNDWPSFSRCRADAANAIANYALHTPNQSPLTPNQSPITAHQTADND